MIDEHHGHVADVIEHQARRRGHSCLLRATRVVEMDDHLGRFIYRYRCEKCRSEVYHDYLPPITAVDGLPLFAEGS